MNLTHVLLVGAGGFAGSVARYLMAGALEKRINVLFPLGTLTVNVLGSLILGVVLAVLSRRSGVAAQEWKLLLATGFCGGFTTFSTFAAENVTLLAHRAAGASLAYVAASVIGGLLALWAGYSLVRSFF